VQSQVSSGCQAKGVDGGRIFNAMTDEQAMWRVQSEGDPAAFAELVGRWEKPVQDLCFRMLGDYQMSMDIAQETFARVFARRKDFSGQSRFSTWLWRIALNLCLDELRKRRRWREESLEDGLVDVMESDSESPDAALASREEAELVRRCLLSLPEHYRSVLVLRHYENLKFAEIAAVLDIPEGTVKSRMAAAMTLLGEKLDACMRGGQQSSKQSIDKQHKLTLI